jgi:enamine deaminase RidA (YjgF/YER057c/UK114 family)
MAHMTHTLISSGSPLEHSLGYSRGVATDPYIFISGCTGSGPDGNIMYPDDAYQHTLFVLQKVERALVQAGAALTHVVRTRVYLTRDQDWDDICRAHGEVFGDIRPASTMVQVVRLLKPGLLVEIEAVAINPL